MEKVIQTVKADYELSETAKEETWLDQIGISQDHLYFSISLSEPTKVEKLSLENYYGLLRGNNHGVPNPIIAIITHFDNLSIAPVDI